MISEQLKAARQAFVEADVCGRKLAMLVEDGTVAARDHWLNPPELVVSVPGAWLDTLHRTLDEAVAAAYGWPATISDDDVLMRLLALNHERAPAGQAAVPSCVDAVAHAPRCWRSCPMPSSIWTLGGPRRR